MADCTLNLPLPPSVNSAWRNVPGRGRVKVDKYKIWERDAGWVIRSQMSPKIKGPVSIFYTFGKMRATSDLSNHVKPIEDLLVKLGVIEDDNRTVVTDFHVSQDQKQQGVLVRVVAVPVIGKEAA